MEKNADCGFKKSRRQTTEDRGQTTEGRGQTTEDTKKLGTKNQELGTENRESAVGAAFQPRSCNFVTFNTLIESTN
jgi:hypothetical protein